MKQPQLSTFVCPTCRTEWQAMPEAIVLCTHGGRDSTNPARLRPPTIATRQKETAPS